MEVSEIRKWKQENGWYINPITGNGVKLGDRVTLGDEVKLGNWVTLGNGVKLGDRVTLGNGVTSLLLNQQIREIYKKQPFHIFTKWVTQSRMSPNFDGGTPLKYDIGSILEEPHAEINDQQCSVGLHVLRYGYRPEWAGLCEADHSLISLDVKVNSEDICFAGLPTMDIKIRVRKLEVLS